MTQLPITCGKLQSGLRLILPSGSWLLLGRNNLQSDNMESLTQILIDPVNSERVNAVHLEDVRMMFAEHSKMKNAILEFCKEQDWACDQWKRQSHIASLFKIAKDLKP